MSLTATHPPGKPPTVTALQALARQLEMQISGPEIGGDFCEVVLKPKLAEVLIEFCAKFSQVA